MNFEVEFHALLNLFATNAKVQINQTMLRVYDIAISPRIMQLIEDQSK